MCPLRRPIQCVSTPTQRLDAGFGLAVPPARHVPLSWFLTTTTVCSTHQLRTYCSSVPTRGSLRFRPLHPVTIKQARWHSPKSTSPQRGFIPLDEFPSLVAVPHHCGRCPLVVIARARVITRSAEASLTPREHPVEFQKRRSPTLAGRSTPRCLLPTLAEASRFVGPSVRGRTSDSSSRATGNLLLTLRPRNICM